MDFLREFVKEDHSYSKFYMEVDSRDDWCSQDGAIQNINNNKNVSNRRVESCNRLQRCFRCIRPSYYDSLSLLQHNLTHLKVIVEKLPDEIFQFLQPDHFGLEYCEEPEVFSEISQYINAEHEHSQIKSEIEDIQSKNINDHFFDEKPLNKDTKNNNNTEFTMKGTKNTIDNAVKFEIEEITAENSMNEFLGVEQLNKNIEHNNNKEIVTKGKLHHIFSNIIKFEIEEISMDQFFDVENSKDIEHNNNIESKDSSKEQKQQCDVSVIKTENINSESSSNQFVNVENTNIHIGFDNNIESEIKRQLQQFDGPIIKCEIEEIYSDNSTDQCVYVENIKKYTEETNDRDIEDKKRQDIGSPIIKTEIGEIDSHSNMDLFEDAANIDKHKGIDIVKTKQKISDDSSIIQSDNKEININISKRLEDITKIKKVRKSRDKVAKPKVKTRQCHICNKFVSYKHLGQHISEVHTQNNVKCEICEKVFKCRKNMRTHFKNVHRLKLDKIKGRGVKIIDESLTFCCDHCQKTFYSKDCLQKHMKNVHGKAVRCEICGSRLASEMYLATHLRRVHYDDGNVHSCDICGNIFKSPRYLKIHLQNSHCVSSKIKKISRKK